MIYYGLEGSVVDAIVERFDSNSDRDLCLSDSEFENASPGERS